MVNFPMEVNDEFISLSMVNSSNLKLET
jgi:hypothetical protein